MAQPADFPLPGAPLAGGAQQPAAARGPPTTYCQLYGDPNRNRPRNLAAYMGAYRFVEADEGAPLPTVAALTEQTIHMCDRWPLTFLCLVPSGDTYKVRVLHRFMRYLDIPGEPPTGLHDTVLALLGDIRPGLYPIVEVPNTVFRIVPTPVNVPTERRMQQEIAALGAFGAPLGPYAEGMAETEAIRTRNIQLVPSQYAPLFLDNGDGLVPLDAYRALHRALELDGNLESCADTLTWLRMASTARGGIVNRAAVPAVSLAFAALHPPEPVYDFLMAKVQGDLPGTRPRDMGVEAAGGAVGVLPGGANLADLVRALADVRGRGAQGEERDRNDEREPKRVSDVYRETYTTLMRHCHVDNVDDVPSLWRRLANASKGEQQSIIQHELSKVCLVRGLAPELYCPVVTTLVKQTITTFAFVGTGVDDLSSGCTPFLVSYAGAQAQQEANEVANLALQLDQGTNQATLADVRSIREKEKVKLPRDLHQVAVTVQRYAVLVHTMFQSENGPRHPFVRSLWSLAEAFTARLPFFVERQAQHNGEVYRSYPTRVLRHIQVRAIEYFQRIASANAGFEAVDSAPTFDELLEDLGRGNFPTTRCWLPLPPSYTSLFSSPPTGGSTVVTFPSTAVPTSSVATRSGISTAGTNASAVSSVTGGTAPSARPPQQREANPTPDQQFLSLQLRPRLGELLRLHRPPTNPAGQEYCVSWWAKGGCNTQCSRRATHCPFASQVERGRLLAHIQNHLTVTASPPGVPSA